mgnify:CR=1 FL=1
MNDWFSRVCLPSWERNGVVRERPKEEKTVKIEESIRAYRFALESGDAKISVVSIRWEGENLVVCRLMKKEGPSLCDEILSAILSVRRGRALRLTVYDSDQRPVKRWIVGFEGVRNRGFEFLDCASDKAALDSVLLTHAYAEEIREEKEET